ncbi:MAG: hypothetical protein AB7F89_04760 [Pirellulaceae bacterium]
MAKGARFGNPFYIVLVVCGVAFALTACAFFVTTLRGAAGPDTAPAEGLLALLDRHGLWLLIGELSILAVATVGAIALDDYGARRTGPSRPPHIPAQEPTHESEPLRGG